MKQLFTIIALVFLNFGYSQTRTFTQPQMPLATDKENLITSFEIPAQQGTFLKNLSLHFKAKKLDLAEIAVYVGNNAKRDQATLFAKTSDLNCTTKLYGNFNVTNDSLFVWVSARTTVTPDLLQKVYLSKVILTTDKAKLTLTNAKKEGQRYALTLRQRKQDGVECYRIPGLTTTNKGTLIAIYDNRYNNCKDLQEDIDVGMSRSTDGGQTWEPMKRVIDMGEWGGLSNQLNGVGDAAVLVDEKTNNIWVMGLWQHGLSPDQMNWWYSKQGMTPQETGQIVVVKSEDDGKTWSQPVSITSQMKDPSWYLFFDGPGRGITMSDGTLVFAGQFKDKDQVPHSTIIYSKDSGKTWHVGTGAKSHTTEAQVVQLTDGSLMLNMRDDRNRTNTNISDDKNGRSVAITKDMGKTWVEHNTSRSALIEPNCMASIISYKDKKDKQYLFFSNPNSKKGRVNMTVKVSDDEGNTWDKLPSVLLHEQGSMGYSCLTIIDNKYVGILYEGNGDLYFQKVPIKEFIK
ncbi:hypothetical protein RCZ04_10160 [Capnocytophaga sp. HP1101]